jgi:hypothetical protein
MIRSVTARLVLGAALVSVVAQAIPGDLLAQASKGVHVCIGTDNVLRFTGGERCPGGQRMFRLSEVEDEVGLAKERDEPTSAVVADLKSKIDFLSRRVANLETDSPDVVGDLKGKVDLLTRRVANLEGETAKRDPVARVAAPFEVVDRAGNPIFVVADALHGSVGPRGRFQIARAVGDNNFTLLVHNSARKSVVGLGEVSDGGAMYIADATGAPKIFGSASSGLRLYGKPDVPTVQLTTGPAGAGQLILADEGGRRMVEAGTVPGDGGMGIVRVGPGFKCVPLASFRVGDCIRGRPEQ